MLKTVEDAIAKHGIEMNTETMIHSDQGAHYTSVQFRSLLKDKELRQSMSRRANCWDLANYIKSLAGFDAENPLNVSQKLIDQHGLFAMTLHRVVGELTTFGTSTLKLDFLGMDLTALLIAYNDSLEKQATLDHTLFLKAANDEDNLFSKQGAVEDEHDLFSVAEEENIFAKSGDPEEDVLAEVVQFFAKSSEVQVEESLFDVTISKAS